MSLQMAVLLFSETLSIKIVFDARGSELTINTLRLDFEGNFQVSFVSTVTRLSGFRI